MAKAWPNTKGFLKEHAENGEPMFLVGAEDNTDPKNIYRGPTAEITWNDDWLYISTDPYEGQAMLNIEALEPLRKALAKIAKARR